MSSPLVERRSYGGQGVTGHRLVTWQGHPKRRDAPFEGGSDPNVYVCPPFPVNIVGFSWKNCVAGSRERGERVARDREVGRVRAAGPPPRGTHDANLAMKQRICR